MDVNEELKFLRKFTKMGGGGVGGVQVWVVRVGGGGGQGGCERKIEVFVKIQKKRGGGRRGDGRVGGVGLGGGGGGQGGCDRRIEVFGKIHTKKKFGGGGSGGRGQMGGGSGW